MSDLIAQFVNRTGSRNPLSQIGAFAGNRMKQRQAMLLQQQQEQAYQNALSTFMNDQTPENRMAVYVAGRPLGQFDQAETMMEEFDTATREANAREVGSVLGPLYAGNIDMASGVIRDLVAAYESAGDTDQVRAWGQMGKAIEAGNVDQVEAMLALEMGLTDEGTMFLDNFHAMNEDRRAQAATEMELLKTADSIKDMFTSDEHYAGALELVDGWNLENAEKAIQLVGGFSELAGMDAKDIVTTYMPLIQEYNGLMKPITDVFRNSSVVRNAALHGKGGFRDQAIITAWNKVLDPGSVVRQAEYANTEAALGDFPRLMNTWDKFTKGAVLDEQGRKDIVRLVDIIENSAKEVQADIQDQIGGLADEAGLKRNIVFGGESLDREELRLDNIRMLVAATNAEPGTQEYNAIYESSFEELQRKYPELVAKIESGLQTAPPEAPDTSESEEY